MNELPEEFHRWDDFIKHDKVDMALQKKGYYYMSFDDLLWDADLEEYLEPVWDIEKAALALPEGLFHREITTFTMEPFGLCDLITGYKW